MNLAILPPSPELNPAGGYLSGGCPWRTHFLSMESVRQASRPLPAPRLHPRVIFFGPGRWPWPCCFWRPARPERFTEVSWTLGSYRRLRLLPLGPVCPEAPHRAGFVCGPRPWREAGPGPTWRLSSPAECLPRPPEWREKGLFSALCGRRATWREDVWLWGVCAILSSQR